MTNDPQRPVSVFVLSHPFFFFFLGVIDHLLQKVVEESMLLSFIFITFIQNHILNNYVLGFTLITFYML